MTDTYSLTAPTIGITGDGALALRTAKFGNGYTQDAADGPNNESQTWPLTWTLNATNAVALMAFIRAHAQGQTFFWTPPLGVQGYYVITKYQIQAQDGSYYTINSTWEQRFKP
jgi:phage-related protein